MLVIGEHYALSQETRSTLFFSPSAVNLQYFIYFNTHELRVELCSFQSEMGKCMIQGGSVNPVSYPSHW